MEKNAVFGELLYVGLAFEKGRYKSKGIWNLSYYKSLKSHIELLREIAKCMQKEFNMENDNYFLRKVYYQIQRDAILNKVYPFKISIDGINKRNCFITACNSDSGYVKLIKLIIELLESVLFELGKGLKKDKEKICRLIFALHNLPRVYLGKEMCTLCLFGQGGIDLDTALEYSKMSMDEEMKVCYKHYFFN